MCSLVGYKRVRIFTRVVGCGDHQHRRKALTETIRVKRRAVSFIWIRAEQRVKISHRVVELSQYEIFLDGHRRPGHRIEFERNIFAAAIPFDGFCVTLPRAESECYERDGLVHSV